MSDVVILVENVSKQYRLGQVGRKTINQDVNRWWYKVRGKEDPYLKIGQVNDRTTKGTSEYVWALKDINFEVGRGEVLGIIGRNGAGKSTLLKILSKVTSPTTGSIKIKGRVAALLEVGTGFHPDLSGRDNIFLNGAILGMTKREIQSKFDEIVDFAGVELYIETPVKRYSSGMYVRLAFAVAAHLEPDILIVDEVLAVGDAEFQKKCLGKMKDVSVKDGRTVLFVSHNMIAVKSLCTKGILLNQGAIENSGRMDSVMNAYISTNKISSYSSIEKEANGFTIHSIKASNNSVEGNFNIEDDLELIVDVSSEIYLNEINVNLFFNTPDGALVFATCSPVEKFERGKAIYKCIIPSKTLNDNMYTIDLMVVSKGSIIIHDMKNVLVLQGNEDKRNGAWLGKFPGLIRPQYFKWSRIN